MKNSRCIELMNYVYCRSIITGKPAIDCTIIGFFKNYSVLDVFENKDDISYAMKKLNLTDYTKFVEKAGTFVVYVRRSRIGKPAPYIHVENELFHTGIDLTKPTYRHTDRFLIFDESMKKSFNKFMSRTVINDEEHDIRLDNWGFAISSYIGSYFHGYTKPDYMKLEAGFTFDNGCLKDLRMRPKYRPTGKIEIKNIK